MTVWVFRARLFHSFHEHGNFWYQILSQGSVATYARCGGIFNNNFIANFLENLSVKKNFKNRLRFNWVTATSLESPFYRDKAYTLSCRLKTSLVTSIIAVPICGVTWKLTVNKKHPFARRLFRDNHKSKPFWILMSQKITVLLLDGSGISWTIFEQSALRSRLITMPTPRHSISTGQKLFLTSNTLRDKGHSCHINWIWKTPNFAKYLTI